MQDSIFTKIIKGDIPCHKVYEDDRVMAFLDIHPINQGHTLLVPKQQIDHLWDIPNELYHHLWDVAKLLQARIKDVSKAPRVGVVVEGFGVPHAHIHLIPLLHPEDIKKHQDLNAEPDHGALADMATKLAI
jgi:histidine triad (HIT) family protein